ncbi:conserved hypothetical protein [Wolbachia endosymbiont of Drosophila ananassae]|nr:conserved hypothetical protein [Wolbachia endosymbiont of Drosophila ananassae]
MYKKVTSNLNEIRKFLDKLCQPLYHDSEAIVFAFANLQIKR